MFVAMRREMIAWFLAGVGLHLMIKNGVSKWNLAALGMSLGIGASSKARRRRKPPQSIEPD
jgi:hypothetical protein